MEILACPHCNRLFRATPAVLGKKIRCRGCGDVFHVPPDTSSVPFGSAMIWQEDEPEPTAIACVVDGRDARRCPQCGRTFGMHARLAGKRIRCRACKLPFRVSATEPTPSPAHHGRAPMAERDAAAAPRSPGSSGSPPPPLPHAEDRPRIFEDIGNVLEDLLPGERVKSVVRPRPPRLQSHPTDDSFVHLVIAIVLGAVCALPVALTILHLCFDMDPLGLFEPESVKKPPRQVVDTVSPPPAPQPVDNTGGHKPTVIPPPPPPPPPPPNVAEIEQALQDAYQSLRQQNFADADRFLADARRAASVNQAVRERVTRWSLFVDRARQFSRHRNDAFRAANQGREYELDGKVFVVVEIGPEHIVYLADGARKRVPLSAVDPDIEMAIMRKWFSGKNLPANSILLGVRWLCFDPPDCRRCQTEWQNAKRRGAHVDELMPLLEDPVIRAAVH